MHQDEELHEKIMYAFRQYFKANQDWMNKATRRAGMDVRYWLNEIKKLSIERRKVVMDWRYDLNEKTKIKKAQKKGTPGDDNAN
jgi:hypothetical protein